MPQPVEPTPAVAPTPSPTSRATVGGDGSAIELAPIREADVEELEGELACSFRTSDRAAPILIGRADVGQDARAFAAVRIGDYPERLASVATGGFGAMELGTRLAGRGLTVSIVRGERLPGGGEAPDWRSTLTVQRADGAERRYEGLWRCGP